MYRNRVIVVALAAVGLAGGVRGAAGNDLAGISDEFSADSRGSWLRRETLEGGESQLERWEINPGDAAGKMVMMPYTSTWYQPYRGSLIYKDVSGDFSLTTQVTVRRRAGAAGVPSTEYSLAGLMLRVAPNPVVAPENYVFLSIGHGTGGAAQFEVKTTMDGTSNLVLNASESLTAELQVARVGDKIITLYKRPADADWVVHRVYDSDSADPFFDHNLGTGTLQAGFVTYTNWEKAQTFDPAYHNVNALTMADNGASGNAGVGFNPDLVAEFDYARFTRLDVPGGLADDATPAEILRVLRPTAVVPEPAKGAAIAAGAAAVLCGRRRRFRIDGRAL